MRGMVGSSARAVIGFPREYYLELKDVWICGSADNWTTRFCGSGASASSIRLSAKQAHASPMASRDVRVAERELNHRPRDEPHEGGDCAATDGNADGNYAELWRIIM